MTATLAATTAYSTNSPTTYSLPTEEELTFFVTRWGNWKQRDNTQRSITRYRLRDLWDSYTSNGSPKRVGGAMVTAQSAIKEGHSYTFFSRDEGRDYFLHYYLNKHQHLINAAFVEGFHAHVTSQGANITLDQTYQWVGYKLADMVWTGYFREQAAKKHLSNEEGWTVREATSREDSVQAIDIVRWSPTYMYEEGIQVKALSFVFKVSRGGGWLLKKVTDGHKNWCSQQPDRHTYIYVPVGSRSALNQRDVRNLEAALSTANLNSKVEYRTLSNQLYLVLTTTPKP